MSTRKRGDRDGAGPSESKLDAGLQAAFGASEGATEGHSVLDTVARLTGRAPKVLLRDDSSPGAVSPVIKAGVGKELPLTAGRGNYQLLGEIASGGMGTVMKGHDLDLGRDVALKVLHDKLASDPDVVQRFIEEAQIGGQLQHPGIVPVYELGLMADDRPFFTMKLVKGRTLAALLRARESGDEDRRRFLSIFEQVCQTVAYAHSKGVLHRDLKPANVMVGAFGEVQVVDWGLAKVLARGESDDDEPEDGSSQVSVIETVRSADSDSTASMVGSVLGTAAYMPPEQARGLVNELTERADVFSLGAILAEILTDSPPYTGSRAEALEAASRAEQGGVRTRLAECGADAALTELCEQCLSPAAGGRPADAAVLAKRIHAYLESVEDRVREAQIAAAEAEVKAREERRARKLSLGLAAALAMAMLGIGGWLWGEGQRAERERGVAAEARLAMADALKLGGGGQWQAALGSAERAGALARTGEGSGELLAEIESLQDTLLAEKQEDERLKALAADNRALITEVALAERVPGSTTGDDWAAMDESILEIFRGHGLTPDEGSLDEAAAQLAARGMSAELSLELDWWAFTRNLSDRQEGIERLHILARMIDDDELRARIRDAFLATDITELKVIARATDIASYPAPTLRLLCIALTSYREFEAIEAMLRRALPQHPREVLLHMSMAYSLSSLGGPERLAEAVRHRYAVRILRPKSAKGAYDLGKTLMDTGEDGAAIESMRDAVALNPDYASALNDLSWFLSITQDPSLRNPEEALTCARRLAEVRDDADSRNTLGVALYRAGKWDECLQLLMEPVERREGLAVDLLVIAMVYHQLGDPEEARVWYDYIAKDAEAYVLVPDDVTLFLAEAAELLGIEEDDDE